MGIIIIPFVSSLSDDAIAAVPAPCAMGRTPSAPPKARPSPKCRARRSARHHGGDIVAASRAIGETMIVVMAAGIIASLTVDLLEPVMTVTVQIVILLIGDVEFDNPKRLRPSRSVLSCSL